MAEAKGASSMKLHDICDEKGCQRTGTECVRYCALMIRFISPDGDAQAWAIQELQQQEKEK